MKSFTDTLREIEYGHLNEELSEGLLKVIKAVKTTQKKGSISLTIKVSPDGDDNVSMTATDPIIKAPTHNRSATSFWLDKDGQPVQTNPNQQEFNLKSAKQDDDKDSYVGVINE